MKQGPHLICGDTSSDVLEKTPDTWTVFVTRDRELAARVKDVCSNSFIIVTEPDILVTILGWL